MSAKMLSLLVCCLFLMACTSSRLSYPPSRFNGMSQEQFAEFVVKYEYDPTGKTYYPGFIEGPVKGETLYLAPKIAHFFGTDGRLMARKKGNNIAYIYYVGLEYQEAFFRNYDSVTDMSGPLPFRKTGNFGDATPRRREVFEVDLSQEKINEGKFDGLFFTFEAGEHEKTAKVRRAQNVGFDLNETLRLVKEARGEAVPEYKDNDNFDLTMPATYVKNFADFVNNN